MRTLLSLGLFLLGASAHAYLPGDPAGELYRKAPRCDDSRVQNNETIKTALKLIKQMTGHTPLLTSCYRDQERQNQIRASYGCGKSNCRGRSATVSQHTTGIAIDISIPGYSGRSMCTLLARVRDQLPGMNGAGGVGAYPDQTGHLDLRQNRCGWNQCSFLGCSNEYISPTVNTYVAEQKSLGFGDWLSSLFT